MKRERASVRRKAVAGIVASILLFSMLFTVGASYFLFVNNANFQYVQSLLSRSNSVRGPLGENLIVTSSLVSGHIAFYVNITGGSNVNMTVVMVLDSGGTVLKCDGKGLPGSAGCSNTTPALPIAVNAGKGSTTIDTGYTYVSGTDTIKILTARGSSFTGTYPPSANLAGNSIVVSGVIGDLYLNAFASYTYYTVTGCGGNQCLTKQGPAFTISASFATSNQLAFSIRVTNLNSNQKNITLDAYSQLSGFPVPGCVGCNFNTLNWYILKNTSNTISNTYSSITLFYNQPVTLVFGSQSTGSFTPFTILPTAISAPETSLVFVTAHGCEGIRLVTCNAGNSYNYGQSIPYVATVYR
jgi:hypothetical protein